jgi:uncharacterized protein YbjT (DUF2867 family)
MILVTGAFMAHSLRWAGTIRAQGAVYQPHGHHRNPAIDEHDIAAVAVAALTQPGHEGQAYELTGPVAISAAEQVAVLGEVLGRPLRFVDVPERAAVEDMRQRGMPAVMADAVLALTRLGSPDHVPAVSPWVERLTGRPARTYAQWAHDHASAFRA